MKEGRYMKTCVKCGKNVADGTKMCPTCQSMAFYTDRGTEGGASLLFDWLLGKNPKLGIIILLILLMGMIAFCIWFFGGLM